MNKDIESLKTLIVNFENMTIGFGIFIVIILIITALFQGLTKGYLNKKFQDIATNENFDELKKQLDENTQIVEKIKGSVQNDVWLSQQVWTKKNESYEKVIEHIFEIKKLLKARLAQNNQWCKSIRSESNSKKSSEKYNSLVNFTDCENMNSFIETLETIEEKIVSKSVFLSIDFKCIATKIKEIRLAFSSIEKYFDGVKAHEKRILKISEVLNTKLGVLDDVIEDVRKLANKELKHGIE